MGEGAFKNKFYALKQTNLDSLTELKQMITETKILAQLQHENIVKQFEAKIHENMLNTRLELCRFSLEEMIQYQKRVPSQIIQLIVRQCVEGFDYLHKNKIYHRDCKPSNILIGYDNKIKISDFNAAKMASSTAKQNTQIGSLAYQAPETLNTDYPINSKIDVFSLGLTVMTMILGKNVWSGKNSVEIINLYMNNTQDDIVYQTFLDKCKEQQIQISGSILEFLQKTTAFFQHNRYTMEECKTSKWILDKRYADIEEAKMSSVINDITKQIQQKRQIYYDYDAAQNNYQQQLDEQKQYYSLFKMLSYEIDSL